METGRTLILSGGAKSNDALMALLCFAWHRWQRANEGGEGLSSRLFRHSLHVKA